MLPATAYTSEAVLAWERRHLFAGVVDLRRPGRGGVRRRRHPGGDHGRRHPGRARARRGAAQVAAFANTCRHRGHELLPDGATSTKRALVCPYHAWSYDLSGALIAAPGFREVASFDPAAHGLVRLPVEVWHGWVFVNALGDAAPFAEHVGGLTGLVAPYRPETLVRREVHEYVVRANWKVITENYHECYHCPLIHPELCAGLAAGQRRELRPARRLGRRLDGPAGRRGHDVARRPQRRPPDRGRRPAHGALPRAAAEPAAVDAPRLRHDPPDGAAVAGGDLGRVRVVLPGRRRRPVVRRGVLGHAPTGRTGRPASRCSAGWPRRTSAPARWRPTRTRCTSSSRPSRAPTATAGSPSEPAGSRAGR